MFVLDVKKFEWFGEKRDQSPKVLRKSEGILHRDETTVK